MSGLVTKGQVLSIYKQLMRESQKFDSYNFRNYALKRIRDAFKENKTLSQAEQVQKQYQFAHENLGIIKRQTIIGRLYSSDQLVIEKQSAKNQKSKSKSKKKRDKNSTSDSYSYVGSSHNGRLHFLGDFDDDVPNFNRMNFIHEEDSKDKKTQSKDDFNTSESYGSSSDSYGSSSWGSSGDGYSSSSWSSSSDSYGSSSGSSSSD